MRSDNPENLEEQARSCFNAANDLFEEDRFLDAIANYTACQEKLRHLLELQPGDPEYRYYLASSYENKGYCLRSSGEDEKSRVQFEQALEIYQDLLDEFPDCDVHLLGVLKSHYNLGYYWWSRRDPEQAGREHRESIELFHRYRGAAYEDPQCLDCLATDYECLGICFLGQENLEESRSNYEKAVLIRESLARREPEDDGHRKCLLQVAYNLGICLRLMGKFDEAIRWYSVALDLVELMIKEDPACVETAILAGMILESTAMLKNDSGGFDSALTLVRQALEIKNALCERFPGSDLHRLELIQGSIAYGNILESAGLYDEALESYQQALPRVKSYLEEDLENPDYLDYMTSLCVNIGVVQLDLGNYDQSRWFAGQALEMSEELLEQNPGVKRFRSLRMKCCYTLAIFLVESDMFRESESLLISGLDDCRKLIEESPLNREYQVDESLIHCCLGSCKGERGMFQASQIHCQQGIDILLQLVESAPSHLPYQLHLGKAYLTLGLSNKNRKLFSEARVYFEKAESVMKTLLDSRPENRAYRRNLIIVENELALCDMELGKPAEALRKLEKILEEYEDALLIRRESRVYREDMGEYRYNAARCLTVLKNFESARELCRTALETRRVLAKEDPGTPKYQKDIADTCHLLGIILRNLGELESAGDYFRESLRIRSANRDAYPDNPLYVSDVEETLKELREMDQSSQDD